MKNKFKVKEERKRTKKGNRKEDLDTERKFETNLQSKLQKEEQQRKLRAIRNQRRKYEMKKREKMNIA